jgi:mono/diheme cytochrome c family protein
MRVWVPLLFMLGAPAGAQDDGAAGVLEKHCVECHNPHKRKGGLDLSTRAELLKGGETGRSVVPGSPEKSLLYRLAAHELDPAMPFKRDKLPDAELRRLADWIRSGFPYPRALKVPAKEAKKEFAVTEADRNHWAFRPLRRPGLPPGPAGHPVDRFVQDRLRAAGLAPAPEAPRETLLRRVTLDLLGLPPAPAEIDAFLGDRSPTAWETVVDRLLASPHYGERWGRHWLDLARFAESNGFEHDAVWSHAWRYRDYVIRSFNADKPFDRFLREQVAGDELWPGDPEALVATGFNLLGPDMDDSSDQAQRRHNTLNDMTDTAASVFLGLTLGCARCHDHKFEPLSQRDYYRFQAFFTPAAFRREAPVPTDAERAAFEDEMKAWNSQPAIRELAALEEPARLKVREQKLAALSPEAMEAHRTAPDKRTTEQANLALETEPQLEVSEKDLAAALSAEERARRKALQQEVRKLGRPPSLPLAMTVAPGKPAKTFVLFRGEYTMPREEVQAGFPEVLGGADAPGPARSALADLLVGHPLTARVMANRIWRHHFGKGLVPTPSEFGPHGQPPTHPELLEWLASEFVARGWSLKAMHRLILTSATYRQASAATHGAKADPENRLLWRMNRLRLEGEVIRDSLLAVSGRLNRAMGGPGVLPPVPPEAARGLRGGWTPSPDPADHARRSVYVFARRNFRFPFLEVFDAPDSNLSCPERGRSTTAPQSLTLLNAEEVMAAAKATAARLEREAAAGDERIRRAYRLALGRGPTERELALARRFLEASPLSEFCRALFNLNAFVYAE